MRKIKWEMHLLCIVDTSLQCKNFSESVQKKVAPRIIRRISICKYGKHCPRFHCKGETIADKSDFSDKSIKGDYAKSFDKLWRCELEHKPAQMSMKKPTMRKKKRQFCEGVCPKRKPAQSTHRAGTSHITAFERQANLLSKFKANRSKSIQLTNSSQSPVDPVSRQF